MIKKYSSKGWIMPVILGFLAAASVHAQVTLISKGAVWKYLDDGSDQGTAWTGTSFDDSSWASGPAELGFGDGGEATTNKSGFITYYYRQSFNVPDASSITNLRALLKRDDGAVVYLNGVEVFRDNMPAGTITAATLAATTAADDGQNFWPHSFAPTALVSGNNVLAVEMHQAALTSSDISFDLELDGNPQPSITINSPTNGQTIASTTVAISGTAVPGGTNISSIQVFNGTTQIGTSTSPSWSVTWTGVSPGTYTLTARITDSSGLVADSAPVNVTVQAPAASMIIPRNSVWNYNNLNVDLGTAWLGSGYDDSPANGWASATAPLGDNLEGAVQEITAFGGTVINIGPSGGRYPTLYFRKTVNVSKAGAYQGLILRVQRDDAAFIYINGNFVTNVGCGGNFQTDAPTLPHTSYCCSGSSAVAGVDETTYWEYRVPSSFLVEGPNVFAVEGRQQAAGSSDLAFDMEVEGIIDLTPPVIVDVDPPQGSTQLSLNFVTVSFDDAVLGVDASDLLINSEPATNVVALTSRDFTFYFPTPATGLVQIAWAPNHGITDASASRNPFDGSSGWTYNFNPNASRSTAVIISEFMADNVNGIKDPLDGKRTDWIELYNGGNLEVNLSGWHLTDDPTNLTKWAFPPVVMQSHAFLLVYASGDNDPTRYLHTNFKLSAGGDYLGLIDADGHIASEFSPTYPPQSADVSYGRDAVDPSLVGYFTTPTPGKINATEGPGFVSEPIFSLASGIYTNDSLTLTISNAQGATIRYTVDGTTPTNTSTIYTGPITISANTTIKARAYLSGTNLFPSKVVAREILLLDPSLQNFNSNLPLLVLDSRSAVPANVPSGGTRAHGNFLVIDTAGGRSSLRGTPEIVELSDFEIYGQTSSGFPKIPYRIEIEDEYNNDKSVSFLGLPADSDWKIRSNWEKSLMFDFLGYELFEQMGHYSCRRRFAEVFVHQGAGKLTASDYNGIQVLFETIKISGHREDLQKLTTSMTNEPDISGGYIFKKDKDSVGDLNFSVNGGTGVAAQALKYHDPKPSELIGTPAGTNQQRYLVGYLNAMVKALSAVNFTTATGTNHYSYYMNVDAFVDQFWIVEFSKQIDGYRLSDYFSKDRNGTIRPEPVWDWNLSFGNANYADGGHSANWYWNQGTDWPWAKRLLTGGADTGVAGDPDFCQKVADRWGVLRTNVMNGPRVLARIDEIASLLTEGATRAAPLGDFTKPAFARLGIAQWPEPNGPPGWDIDYVNPLSYSAIVQQMKKWVNGRFLWIDSLFLPAVTFSQPEGMVTNGTTITLSVTPGSTNFYTLDGTDPRAPGGTVAPGAQIYTGPITINGNVRIFVRSQMAGNSPAAAALVRPFQNTWGAPAVATYFTSVAPLRITEIMYHPTGIVGNTNDNDNFEYIEVQNIGGTPLNVNRFSLGGGIQFQFPNAVLAAGEYAVIVKDTNAFQLRYGTNTVRILGTYTGNLANSGDHVVLAGPVQEPIQDFTYSDSWYPATDGAGFSLVLTDPNADPNLATSWRASAAVGGSPAAVDPTPAARPPIVVNEVRTYGDPLPDAIELYNPTASSVNIGGWFLTDDFNKPQKYIIPPVTIAAHGYVVFTENDFNSNTNDPNSFALGRNGDSVYLFSGNGVDLTGYAQGFDFGAAEAGVDFGRYVDSTGDDHFVAQSASTLGATNGLPKVGPIVISEIMYHPSDIAIGTNGLDNTDDEFIELQNITGSDVNLYDATYPSNTWHLREAVSFDFPQNTTIPAGAFALVVGFDPASNPTALSNFRAHHQVPNGIPIFGPWSGKLANDTDKIELHKPRASDTNATYVLVERIVYNDSAPWPTGADGFGLSLQRIVPSSFGNDPANWAAALVSPGANYVPGATAPTITSQPGDQLIFAGSNVTFTASATGTAPLRYQWRFMNQNLAGATNSTLVINNFQVNQAGVYNVLVLNSGGYALGTNFTITSRVKLGITVQPVSATVLVGATTNLTVNAVGSGTLRYQWYFNGNPISTNVTLTATNSTLTLTNIQTTSQGNYFCRLVDDFDVLDSTVVPLVVASKPVYAITPAPVTVVEGGTAVFNIAANGTAPMFFNWRTNGFSFSNALPNATIIRNPTNSILILNNVSLTFSNYTISATVTNIIGTATGAIPGAKLFVLPDSDHDGLPDSWEATHAGFNPNDPADGARDNDGDGMSNRDEYIAGTDPVDPASYLKVQTVGPGIGRLQFTAVSNRTYTVQFTDTLTPPVWQKLADVLGRTNNTTRTETVVDPNATTNRFYRLVIPIQP